MFGIKCFILKTILLWSLVTVVLVESAARQKKDVHHMIILNDGTKPPKTHRYKHHSHRTVKRKPSRKHKHRHSSSSEESFEESSEEDFPPPTSKSKAKRHHNHHKHNYNHRHKYQKHHKEHRDDHNRQHPNSYAFPESKWVPMSSHELFGRNHQNYQGLTPPAFAGGYQSGAIHYSQPIPMEITTSLPLAHTRNSFVTLYPPLDQMNYDSRHNSPLIGAVDSYKPYDYSVLEQNSPNLPLPSPSEALASQYTSEPFQISSTPLSIVVDNSAEAKAKEVENAGGGNKKGKYKRGRGSNRYRIRRKNN